MKLEAEITLKSCPVSGASTPCRRIFTCVLLYRSTVTVSLSEMPMTRAVYSAADADVAAKVIRIAIGWCRMGGV